MIPRALSLTLLEAPLALCRLRATDDVPAWATSARTFLSISRTADELSVVADEAVVPNDVHCVRAYRALRVDGPLPLELVGILVAIAVPLADAGVPIFPIATYDTDYILVQQSSLSRALEALKAAGHRVAIPG